MSGKLICIIFMVASLGNISAIDDFGDQKNPLIVDVEIKIEGVSRQSSSTVVNLTVENNTALEWEILDFKGTCSCFKQASFQRILHPRQKVIIPLEFDFRSYSRLNSFSTLVAMSVKSGTRSAVVGPIKVMGSFVDYENIILYPPHLELRTRSSSENKPLGYVIVFKHKKFVSEGDFRPVLSNSSVNLEAIQARKVLHYGDYEEIARFAVTENIGPRGGLNVQSVSFDIVSSSTKSPVRIGGEIRISYSPSQ